VLHLFSNYFRRLPKEPKLETFRLRFISFKRLFYIRSFSFTQSTEHQDFRGVFYLYKTRHLYKLSLLHWCLSLKEQDQDTRRISFLLTHSLLFRYIHLHTQTNTHLHIISKSNSHTQIDWRNIFPYTYISLSNFYTYNKIKQ
jgi:hypothetical protein